MKTKIYIVIIAIMLCSVNVVNAIVKSNPGEKREATTTKQEMQDRKDEIKDRNEENRKEMVRKVFSNQLKKVGSRLDATIVRIEGLMSRINSRIEKIKNAGGKTDTAEKYVSDAKTHLTDARTELAKLKVLGDTSLGNVSSTTPMTKDLSDLKASSKIIEKHIQEAHKLLEKALGSLKGLSSIAPNATSTKKTN